MRTLVVVLVFLAAFAAPAQKPNVVCVPDPLAIVLDESESQMDVWYLGGAADTLFAYAVSLAWDPTVVACTGLAEGDLFDGCSPHGSWFVPEVYADSLYIMHFNLGWQYPGTLGPGVMFTTQWVGESEGESVMRLRVWHARNNENEELRLTADDGLIVVSLAVGIGRSSVSWSMVKSFYR